MDILWNLEQAHLKNTWIKQYAEQQYTLDLKWPVTSHLLVISQPIIINTPGMGFLPMKQSAQIKILVAVGNGISYYFDGN